MTDKHGFTLIELMVTITIIAILSVIGLATFQKTIVNSRDMQRIRDLQSFRQALELYRNDQHYYPSSYSQPYPSTNPSFFDPGSMSQLSFGSKVYLNLPTDPSGSGSGKKYGYQAVPTGCDNSVTFCASYIICSSMEGNITLGQGANKVYSCSDLATKAGVNTPLCGNGKSCVMGIASD